MHVFKTISRLVGRQGLYPASWFGYGQESALVTFSNFRFNSQENVLGGKRRGKYPG